MKVAAQRQTPAMAAVWQAAAAAAASASAAAAAARGVTAPSLLAPLALGLAGACEGAAGGVSGRGAGPEGEPVASRSSSAAFAAAGATAAAATQRVPHAPATDMGKGASGTRRGTAPLWCVRGDSSSAPLMLRVSEAQAAATTSSSCAQPVCVLIRGSAAESLATMLRVLCPLVCCGSHGQQASAWQTGGSPRAASVGSTPSPRSLPPCTGF